MSTFSYSKIPKTNTNLYCLPKCTDDCFRINIPQQQQQQNCWWIMQRIKCCICYITSYLWDFVHHKHFHWILPSIYMPISMWVSIYLSTYLWYWDFLKVKDVRCMCYTKHYIMIVLPNLTIINFTLSATSTLLTPKIPINKALRFKVSKEAQLRGISMHYVQLCWH